MCHKKSIEKHYCNSKGEIKINPVLKWVGGKRKLTTKIISLFPKDFKDRSYHEPFFGGGAVFYNVQPKIGSINDINRQLMAFYIAVRDNPNELIQEAKKYHYDKETYYRLRERYNKHQLHSIEEAALFLYLIKSSFNGMYRVNSKGEFNSGFGRPYTRTRLGGRPYDRIIVPEERLMKLSCLLKDIEIFNTDFSYICDYAKEGDIVYLDPPYQPVDSKPYFTSYSAKGFTDYDQMRLRDVCTKLDENKVLFVLSNSCEENIMKSYSDMGFEIHIVKSYRCVGGDGWARKKVNDVLVTNNNKLTLA